MLRMIILLLAVSTSTQALGWGSLGHRITGDIAMSLLTPAARQRIQVLLGEESLAEATTFMDRERDALQDRLPGSTRWHYDNQPVCGQRSYCTDGHCATRQIPAWQRRLGDPRLSNAERALALRLLVHMVGDIHQPLHMSDNDDRGGNQIRVRLYSGAERQTLHEVLDTTLVRRITARRSSQEMARQLLKDYQSELSRWQSGTPTSWADESHRLGVELIYRPLPLFACHQSPTSTVTLQERQVQQLTDLTAQQLTRAGVRIAAVLNATLQ